MSHGNKSRGRSKRTGTEVFVSGCLMVILPTRHPGAVSEGLTVCLLESMGPGVECNVISNEFCVTLGRINGRTSTDYKCPGVQVNLMKQK